MDDTMRLNTKQQIEVMQAYLDGKPIEFRSVEAGDRDTFMPIPQPDWNWYDNEYRVMVEPRELWMVLRSDGTPTSATYATLAEAERMRDSFNGGGIAVAAPYTVMHLREVLP